VTGAPTNVLRVGQLTARIGERLQATDEFKDLWVEGEIVETSRSSAGHVYFTLKDNTAQLQCVLFATQAMNVPLTPRQGLRVVAHGYIEVYVKAGSYNLRCDDVRPAGAGDAFLRLEALRKRLEAEGLFKQERKRSLPPRPRRVGVITSPTGARGTTSRPSACARSARRAHLRRGAGAGCRCGRIDDRGVRRPRAAA